ncbi:MAG: hypothetical protein BWX88_02555 [Planctomycetes bacterium ADurb.Bin126]|nr:MAG: hypothetical protein BWX88_02555 [Planctomycetes bacterium ADurb.Bin126]
MWGKTRGRRPALLADKTGPESGLRPAKPFAKPVGAAWPWRQDMEILFVVLVVAVIAAVAIFGHLAAMRRRKELAAFAQGKGLWFSEARTYDLDNQFPAFPCLRKGSNRYAYNMMGGTWGGRQVKCFDYHYETHSTDSKGRRQTHHHYFSGTIVASPIPLEPLFIRPEGFFDKITEFFGADDIDFESAEFSRKFYVKAPDKKWAYDVIHTRTMEFLLGQPKFHIHFDRTSVLVYRERTFTVNDFEPAIETAAGILERLPEYLVRQQQEKQA